MNNLTKRFIASTVAATLVLSAGSAMAMAGQGRSDGHHGQQLSYIFTQLELNETQQAAVLDVLEAQREVHRDAMWEQMKELRDRDERPSQEEMQALREAYQTSQMQALTDQLNTVLSPEITAELVEYLEAHQGVMGGSKKSKHSGKGFQGRGQ